MQLSEDKIMELARSVPGSESWSIGCVRFARLLENEILRAQADARPVAWRVTWHDHGGNKFGPRYFESEEAADDFVACEAVASAVVVPLYTHPEASAPGLIDQAIAICQEEGDEWDSDRVQATKNYAHACRDRIRALTRASATTLSLPPTTGLPQAAYCASAATLAEPAGSLVTELRRLQAEAEKKRQTEENPNLERIYLGMRDAYDIAANRAAQQQAEPVSTDPYLERIKKRWREEQQAIPAASFEDPRVQTVYEILCRNDDAPVGEHWEGFQARLIVDALFGQQAEPGADERATILALAEPRKYSHPPASNYYDFSESELLEFAAKLLAAQSGQRAAVAEEAATRLYLALKDLLASVDARPNCCGIAPITIKAAVNALRFSAGVVLAALTQQQEGE